MRYTISSPETEQRLATVDHLDSREGAMWSVLLPDAKGAERKLEFAGARVSVAGGMVEVYLPSNGGRMVFPATPMAADGTISIATALGTLRLLPSRGAVSESGAGAAGGSRSIKSSMPGKVLKILCKPGDLIEAGQPLLIIEAMKMENEIRSPLAGKVEAVPVQPGQNIQTGELLAKIGKADA